MARIFISYRRKTWPFTQRLANSLRWRLLSSVFVDVESIDEDDFEDSILKHLRRSDIFLLVVSEHTFAPDRINRPDDWVRREIAEALEHDIPIVTARIDGIELPQRDDLPPDICSIVDKQGEPFYAEYFAAGVRRLVRLIRRVLQARRPRRVPVATAAGMLLAAAAVIAALALLNVFGGGSPQTAPQPTQQAVIGSTDEPLPTLTAGERIRALAEAGVTRNAEWTPYTEVINGVKMALVPAGCFEMGSSDHVNEQPVHRVCFEQPFWIDVYEVTNEAFGSVGCIAYSSDPDQPRNCVSWTDAQAHCEARGARLPTEAEWEYAARGPDGLVYPWGDEFVAGNAVYGGNSSYRAWTIGSKPGGISWIGAYDLSGNVWEWVADWYGSYPPEQQLNPGGPDSGEYRVLRGGSWYFGDSNNLRGAHRGQGAPHFEAPSGGFRCALSYQP